MGILPELEDPVRNKRARYAAYAARAEAAMADYLAGDGFHAAGALIDGGLI